MDIVQDGDARISVGQITSVLGRAQRDFLDVSMGIYAGDKTQKGDCSSTDEFEHVREVMGKQALYVGFLYAQTSIADQSRIHCQ